MKKSQTGSAHIVIIIVLVAAVLGLLGFVFWQNVVNKTPTPTSSAATSQVTQSNKSLVVKEWGVKASIGDISDLSYHISTNTTQDGSSSYDEIYFQPKGLPSDCAPANIDVVYRLTADQQVPDGNITGNKPTAKEDLANNNYVGTKIGQYYYIYLKEPGGVCGDDTVMAEQEAANIFAQNFARNVIAE